MNNNFNSMNFFYSANSEAYQDAFLTWIFYNFYNDNSLDQSDIEVKNFSKFMLKKLVKLKNDDEIITEVEPDTQVKNSDIILNITTNKNIYLVIIEDKTGSSIHPSNKENGESYQTQLEKYYDIFMEMDKYTNLFKEGRVFLYYYKNEYVNNYENRVVSGANSRLLKNVYVRKIKNCEKAIEKAKKEIVKYNQDKGKDHHTAIKNRENTIKENELRKNKLESEYNDLESRGKTKSLCEWEIFGIDDIYDLFEDFKNKNEIKEFDNIILRDYYHSIKFWHNQYEKIEEKILYEDDDPEICEFLWNEQSPIWNPVFEELMNKVNNSKDERFEITTYNGKYWQLSLTSKNNRTCILLDAKHIKKDSVTITINLRNEKYGDKDLPWGENKSKREKDRKSIVDVLEKSNNSWKLNKRENSENNSNDINLLAGYTAKTDNNEKTSLQFLIKTWKKVEKDLSEIEYTDFENKTVKVFEK